jgi:hypothetical protein
VLAHELVAFQGGGHLIGGYVTGVTCSDALGAHNLAEAPKVYGLRATVI